MAEEPTTAGLERTASRVTGADADEDVLAEFGYKQELRRDWGLMHNFGISFSIIVCAQKKKPFQSSGNQLTTA
jgi:hypothetical protein